MQLFLFLIGIIVAVGIWSLIGGRGRARAGNAGAADRPARARRPFPYGYTAPTDDLARIADPREAAAVMMMEVARARGGPLTGRQSEVIVNEIMHHFGFTRAQADDLAAHAAWVTHSAPPPAMTMQRLSQRIVASPLLGPKEIVDLDGMLVAVSEAEGLPTRDQLTLLQAYRDEAGLKT